MAVAAAGVTVGISVVGGAGVAVMASEVEVTVVPVGDGAEATVAPSTSRTRMLFQAWVARSRAFDFS